MRVMIIGASTNRAKFGNKAVRAYLRRGHEILPVNPRGGEIEGLTAYRDPTEPPGPIDRVSVYLRPEVGIEAVRRVAARDDFDGASPPELWLNPGAESDELVREARRLGFDPIVACSIVDIGETP